jgi:hypothetical protein
MSSTGLTVKHFHATKFNAVTDVQANSGETLPRLRIDLRCQGKSINHD